jgi:hypothetical protein
MICILLIKYFKNIDNLLNNLFINTILLTNQLNGKRKIKMGEGFYS